MALANRKLYYWTSGNEAEVDFLLSQESGIIPCEVKAADNISAKNFGFENGIKSVPLYATHCIE